MKLLPLILLLCSCSNFTASQIATANSALSILLARQEREGKLSATDAADLKALQKLALSGK